MDNLYLRFFRIARAIKIHKNETNSIDATAILLLNEVAVRHFEGKNITVT